MSVRELYVKGARVWIPDQEQVWRCAELTKDYKNHLVAVIYENSQTDDIKVKSDEHLPPLRNPDILIGENDLTSLSYLHEPAVLYNLQVRFCNHNAIYTYCGIVLVAINPYEELPIYGPDTISAYRGHSMGDLDPHIFAVAEEAFTQMERENKDQSIIVSGESGAGKTVSAKYAMRYFASVGGSDSETQIEKKILASNPIMEAIGNAKTTRNDNSSRFGKYIELDFTRKYSIMGANMRTYLLEKSRVVFQAPEERNYHIFYQLCSASSDEKLKHLKLGSPESFHYMNQGLREAPKRSSKTRQGHQDNFHYLKQGRSPHIEGVDDAADFQETCRAFSLLGMNEATQEQMFTILAGILHLGNVTFEEDSGDSSTIDKKDKSLHIAAELLGIQLEDIQKWLCHRKIVSGREVFTKPMTFTEATFSRDALAKHIYAKLFDWIVMQINKCFAATEKPFRFIGVLDIYGFETFEINSFEQFCINYANEKLQQQFNQHVFKLEQEEYVKEQIEWEFINFYDNQPCIDLIESKLGILDLLDEECRMPKGSDQSWVEKLYDKCKKWDHFSKPRLSNTSFLISHFADKVGYECAGFLEKNRDTVSEDQISILKSSQIKLVHALFTERETKAMTKVKVLPSAPPHSKSKQMKKTVGSQFRESLNLLMLTLNSTTPHYVRCIKPNDDKMAFTFDPTRAIQQLRACGVLETVRISAAGYPSRWTYNEFFCRYRVLCNSKDIKWNDMRVTCERIIANMINDEDKFKFGRTKIFFRAGQVAYMEKLRADRLSACGVMIQKHVRMFLHRNRFRTMRKAAVTIQRYSRGTAARRRVHHMRQTAAAIRIQACVRGWVKFVQYRRLVYTITQLQAHARGAWARKRYEHMRRVRAAIVIQKNIRSWLTREHFKKAMLGIVILQGMVRCFLARKKLKKLKIEAKSVEHQKKLNKGLENKIISLQQKLTEMKHENNFIKGYKEEITVLKGHMVEMKLLEVQQKNSTNRIAELEAKVSALTEEVEKERGEKMDVLTEKEQAEKDNREIVEKLNAENVRLSEELEKAQKEESKKESEELLRRKFEAEKQQIIMEGSDEKSAYQRLLKEFNRLEQKNDILEEQLVRVKGSNVHKRTASNVSNISGASDAPTELVRDDASEFSSIIGDDDIGYGSVRSRASEFSDSSRNLENIDWSSPSHKANTEIKIHVPEKVEDITLVLQLQNKVRELEKERRSLAKQIDQLESSSPMDDPQHAQELIRLQELEMENAKLKDDLNRLRKSIADSEPQNNRVQEFMKQFEALQDELERRREECIQLRTVLANRAHDLRSLTQTSYGKDVDIVNEDGELALAYQTQKQVNRRQLEEELKTEKLRYRESASEYKGELERLRRDNERQQKLLAQNLTKGDGSNPETLLQSEIMRLTSENLTSDSLMPLQPPQNLQGQVDSLTEQLKKYKRSLRAYAKKLKEAGGSGSKRSSAQGSPYGGDPPDLLDVNATHEGEVMPVIRKKERDYMGMFEYDRREEMQIIRVLIYELKPRVAVTFLPGLPAYILFMCIRHTDHINDDEKVRSLLNNIVNGVKRVIKKRHEDLDSTVLWLSNVLRLLHNLKQYSGDKAFQAENTVKQNEQSLKNFDLSEYRQVLSDIAVWIYNGVIKLMEEKVQPLIVPSILEHEAITGLSGNKPGGMRGRAGSLARELESPVEPQKALDLLLKEMTQFYRTLAMFGTDPELITQVFRQIFYFICAGSLNNLLLRKDMCHWSKGMQIRYNLSHLEQWTRDMRLHESGVTDTLAPIIQAAQLLQARKTDDDVHSICDMCDKLSVSQIIKILNLYTPADEFEERVPITFIHKIQAKLQERAEGEQAQATLLMNTKFAFPVRFPFNPSSIHLEDVELPEALPLGMLKKV
ncbi:unconventional myosin-Va-like isoform X3 [Homarus americanus]|uniref:unconventional myosin-Va-like isoform X3 n=1 Tax=Homarus americanus TaxID=6706 RepID=UPI001C456F87|nr:unconventional myosin-Va-like isoform X3 [Homarus americanus]